MTVLDINSYVAGVLAGYERDPADSDYQKGYLACVQEIRSVISETPERVEVVEVRPGDVLVVRSPHTLSTDQHQRIVTYFKEKVPGVEVAVLDHGLTLEVIRPPVEDDIPDEAVMGRTE